jgi:hypothetical protein
MDDNKVRPIRPGIENAIPVPVEQKIALTINCTFVNGMVVDMNISGPIANKILCYGILAGAHDVIKEYNPNPNPSNLITPDPNLRSLLKI